MTGRLLERALEVRTRGETILMSTIVLADRLPERLCPNLAAQHVKYRAALLIDELRNHAAEIGDVLVDQRLFGLRGRACAREHALYASDERVVAHVVLVVQRGEIRREALAEPGVVPVALGDRVSKPLMRDFVSDRSSARWNSGDALLCLSASSNSSRETSSNDDKSMIPLSFCAAMHVLH